MRLTPHCVSCGPPQQTSWTHRCTEFCRRFSCCGPEITCLSSPQPAARNTFYLRDCSFNTRTIVQGMINIHDPISESSLRFINFRRVDRTQELKYDTLSLTILCNQPGRFSYCNSIVLPYCREAYLKARVVNPLESRSRENAMGEDCVNFCCS